MPPTAPPPGSPAPPAPEPAPTPATPEPSRWERARDRIRPHQACIVTALLACLAFQVGAAAIEHCPRPTWPATAATKKPEPSPVRHRSPRRRVVYRTLWHCCYCDD